MGVVGRAKGRGSPLASKWFDEIKTGRLAHTQKKKRKREEKN